MSAKTLLSWCYSYFLTAYTGQAALTAPPLNFRGLALTQSCVTTACLTAYERTTQSIHRLPPDKHVKLNDLLEISGPIWTLSNLLLNSASSTFLCYMTFLGRLGNNCMKLWSPKWTPENDSLVGGVWASRACLMWAHTNGVNQFKASLGSKTFSLGELALHQVIWPWVA